MKPALLISLGLLLSSCQEYEFQPLSPVTFRQTVTTRKVVAKQYKPNLMLVVDRSQSMDFPISTGGETRWSALKRAMNEYLTSYGTVARTGLMTFPTGDACGAGSIAVDLWTKNDVPDDLQNHARNINAAIQNTRPSGVTPTGDSLRVLADYQPLMGGRENVVVLITDGLPNCNASNPNSHDVDAAACDCTFAASQCGGTYSRMSCLDSVGTVSAVRALLAKGIKTAVVGIGPDMVIGTGPQVMNAIASEGGAPRACPNGTDDECGSANTCDRSIGLCNLRFYRANEEKELASALATIGYSLSQGEKCKYQLEVAPADASYLSVRVNQEAVAGGPDTWTYDAGTVTFTQGICSKISSSTPDDPVLLDFLVLETL
jgi:hypothetical protein